MDEANLPSARPDHPALRRCIAVEPDEFACSYWSRRPLLSAAVDLPRRFDDLLSLAAVDELLSRHGLRTPFLRVVKEGRVVESSRFTRGGGAGAEIADQVAGDRVLELFLDGSTLVLQGLHRAWPSLIAFASELTTDLGHPVQVNAYVTPPSSRGFDAHYDVHDVFVLQVAGEKRWVVHAPVHPAPLPDQPWTDRRAAVAEAVHNRPPILDTLLRSGDTLYLPRGYLHAAHAQANVSAHLTVGVPPLTRYALVEALADLAAGDQRLRSSLPLGVDLADPACLTPDLDATIEAFTQWLRALDSGTVAARLRRMLWQASPPVPISPLAQASVAERLAPATRLRLRDGVRHVLHPDGDRVILELSDRRITLPAFTTPALGALLSGQPVAVGELPGLDDEDQQVLGRRLLREAVVVPAGP